MTNIEIRADSTLIGRAVKFDRWFSHLLFRIFFLLFSLSAFAAIMVFLASAFGFYFDQSLIGALTIIFGLFLFFLPLRLFYRHKLRYPQIGDLAQAKEKITKGEKVNLFNLFSFELARVYLESEVEQRDIALTLLETESINFILTRLGIGRSSLWELLAEYKCQIAPEKIILASLDIALAETHHQIEVGDLFIAFCQLDPLFKKIITDLGLDLNDIAHLVYWQTSLIRRSLSGRRFLDPGHFHFNGGIGRDWAFGFTPILNQFGRDLTSTSANLGLEVIGREKEIEEIEQALLREHGGNVVLVGEPGIGKRTTVLALAKKISLGEFKNYLAQKHLIEIDLPSLLSGGSAAERLSSLLFETVSAGNMILFIENFLDLLNNTSLILPFLDSPDLHIIAACDSAGYNALIRPNSALNQRLTRVTVAEPDRAKTIRILEEAVILLESKNSAIVSFSAIKAAAELADKYIVDAPNPERAINLLDGALAKAVRERGKTIILPKDITDYLSSKYDLPAAAAAPEERQKLLKLEEEMHKRVIGQDEAIRVIAEAMRRVRAGVSDSKKPIGSFLFLGPTGVGKTETAKALAEVYFGGVERMVRFNMSEFKNRQDVYRLIGSNIGGEAMQGELTTAVREHPFSLLLFDEIEKANFEILDLFLQILDEGELTDGLGRKALFKNTIIICTSNAGADFIRQRIAAQKDLPSKALLDYIQKEGIFRPEFLNRFNQIVAFSPLSAAEIMQIAKLLLEKTKAVVLKNRGIKFDVEEKAVEQLVKLGFTPEMGARPMARIIEDKIENLLAKKILSAELKQGDSYLFSLGDLSKV